jgi:hypothetical protein
MVDVLCGDSAEVLTTLEAESVSLVCTDPPYGWSFMGRSWDKALPDPAIWRECLRVLKPGGFALVMSGVRSDCLWRLSPAPGSPTPRPAALVLTSPRSGPRSPTAPSRDACYERGGSAEGRAPSNGSFREEQAT